jgi:hypothetical protein
MLIREMTASGEKSKKSWSNNKLDEKCATSGKMLTWFYNLMTPQYPAMPLSDPIHLKERA